jgi:5-methyltetrahydrofolate--homocysteine methyltransferase
MLPPLFGIYEWPAVKVSTVAPLIDWKMYFSALSLRPSLCTPAHQEVRADSLRLLEAMEGRLGLRAVYGFWPVERRGDDLAVFSFDAPEKQIATLYFLRQQNAKEGEPCLSVADFFNPHARDRIGLFATTAGLGLEEILDEFRQKNDDYSAILAQLLADRLAEALTESLHRALTGGQGVRMAPGYPASPDHAEKATIWKLLEPDQHIGVSLSETFVMQPVASECGYLVTHPASRYFNIGPIGADQLSDYARRKGQSESEVRKWIASL